MQQLQIFTPKFNNEELENEVQRFFNQHGLLPLFTNEHRANHISISYSVAKSLTNPESKYYKSLAEFGDRYLQLGQDNKSYEEALFKILYESKTVQGMVNKINRYMAYIDTLGIGYLHNTWNIVWYKKDLR